MAKRNANMIAELVICCCLFAMILTGCIFWFESEPVDYSFRQDRGSIEKVEICEYRGQPSNLVPIIKLTENEIDSILTEIKAVDCYTILIAFDPIVDYGGIAVAITYADGEKEMIGIYNVGYIKPSGTPLIERYQFQPDGIRAVINKYLDLDAYFAQKRAESEAADDSAA